jgi:hypothetical protein
MENNNVPSGNPLNPSGLPQVHTETDLKSKIENDAKKNIYTGLGLIILSIIVTVISYKASTGSTFSVFWGIGIFGSVIFARGVYNFTNPYASVAHSAQARSGFENKKGKGIAAVIAALFVVYVMSGVITKALVPELSGKFNRATYTANVIKGCKEAGGGESFCGCAATYLVAHSSEDRLKEIDNLPESEPNPPETTEAAHACQSEFQNESGSTGLDVQTN